MCALPDPRLGTYLPDTPARRSSAGPADTGDGNLPTLDSHPGNPPHVSISRSERQARKSPGAAECQDVAGGTKRDQGIRPGRQAGGDQTTRPASPGVAGDDRRFCAPCRAQASPGVQPLNPQPQTHPTVCALEETWYTVAVSVSTHLSIPCMPAFSPLLTTTPHPHTPQRKRFHIPCNTWQRLMRVGPRVHALTHML